MGDGCLMLEEGPMQITSVWAALLQERVLWARPVEKIVTVRAQDRGAARSGPSLPTLGSVLAEIEFAPTYRSARRRPRRYFSGGKGSSISGTRVP